MEYYVLSLILYGFGVFFYVYRTPERQFKKTCDVCCSSHQIFHVFTIFGAIVTYYGIIKTHEMAKSISC